MVTIYGTKYRSMTAGHFYTVTAHGNVLFKENLGYLINKWRPCGLNPADITEMYKAGILYKTKS